MAESGSKVMAIDSPRGSHSFYVVKDVLRALLIQSTLLCAA